MLRSGIILYGVVVGKAVMVGLGGAGVEVAEGVLVSVGLEVAVYGRGVVVYGKVGSSVGLPKSGIIVTPGVMVGELGTHNISP